MDWWKGFAPEDRAPIDYAIDVFVAALRADPKLTQNVPAQKIFGIDSVPPPSNESAPVIMVAPYSSVIVGGAGVETSQDVLRVVLRFPMLRDAAAIKREGEASAATVLWHIRNILSVERVRRVYRRVGSTTVPCANTSNPGAVIAVYGQGSSGLFADLVQPWHFTSLQNPDTGRLLTLESAGG